MSTDIQQFFKFLVDEGGDLTLYMTGKKPRPRTEPMYSGGNLHDFNITSGYDTVDFSDFISSNLSNSHNILISCTIHDGTFSGVFASSKLHNPRPAMTWGFANDFDEFLEFASEECKPVNGKSKGIYSLTCDKNFGFGVLFMEGYGRAQAILTSTANIQEEWDDDFMITSCAALDSTFYIIMTKGTEEYHGKGQQWFTLDSWKEANDEIQEGYRDGYALTGISYSIELKQYFVVMTASKRKQCYRWFRTTEGKAMDDWEKKKYDQGFHTTIIFNDPTDKKTLVVMTKDENRLGHIRWSNVKLR